MGVGNRQNIAGGTLNLDNGKRLRSSPRSLCKFGCKFRAL
ncbi:MAG: hypothetical protein JWP25_4347 [Bradyrhizobium sp.]|nr:hypothetical protein [Bradyrhizobium sp.]